MAHPNPQPYMQQPYQQNQQYNQHQQYNNGPSAPPSRYAAPNVPQKTPSTHNGMPPPPQSNYGAPPHPTSQGVNPQYPPSQHQHGQGFIPNGPSRNPNPGYQQPPLTQGYNPGNSLAGPPMANPNRSSPANMPLHGNGSAPPTSAPPPPSTLNNSFPGYNNYSAPPPLPGQNAKSFTPPPAYSQHNSQGLQAQQQRSTNSTPTHKPPNTGLGPPPMGYQQTQAPPAQPVLSAPPLPGQQMTQTVPQAPVSDMQGHGLPPPPLPGQQYVPPQNVRPPPPMANQMHPPAMQPPPPTGNSMQPPPVGGQQMNHQPPIGQGGYPQPATSYAPSAFTKPPTSYAQGPQDPYPQPPGPGMQNLTNSMGNMGMGDANRPVNLMQETRILPIQKPVENPLRFESTNERGMLIPPNRKNCSPEVLRCTLKKIPHTKDLLGKVKLPFGLVIHPFRDLNSLPVISAGTIVRCKRCRTYINPFVSFIDERKWRCNMCFGVNDTPEEFLHHPVTKTYGMPHTRPECTNATIEFIAPQEYMLRPPQPAVYLFLMDVSHSAIESGYLQVVCDALLDNLDRMPGDRRTRIGFLTYNLTVHFYRLSEGLSQPQMIVVSDIDDVFLPTPENLLVNLHEGKALVQDLLHQLPIIHNPQQEGEVDTYSALGAALEVAKKLMGPFGGRVTVFQQAIPSIGPGTLKSREDPNSRAGDAPTANLNPATDYYKKMALECSAHQVAIDMFFFNSRYIDIATLSCSSRFSAGDLHYYPSLHTQHNPMEVERLRNDLERYLTRKIGFEAVMRIRCTKGLSIHTFHGNFFVRSTDLLSLANVSPDSGFAVNLSIDENLTDQPASCVQAALLYTTSRGERRIRVHTMCIPIAKTEAEVLNNVDCNAVVTLLAKMAVDRSVTASLQDARDALLNAVIDPLKAFKGTIPQGMGVGGLYVPKCLRLFPLYVQSLLKHPAFRSGVSTRLDDRVFSMINFKMQPTGYFLQDVHPDLYRVDDLHDEGAITVAERDVPQPNLLPLSAESISQSGCFLLDCGWKMYLLVGRQTSRNFINDVLGCSQFSNIEDPMYSIPELENPTSELFHSFIEWLRDSRPHHAPIRVIRDDSRERILFFSQLHQDRTESSMSFQEFLMHVQQKIA